MSDLYFSGLYGGARAGAAGVARGCEVSKVTVICNAPDGVERLAVEATDKNEVVIGWQAKGVYRSGESDDKWGFGYEDNCVVPVDALSDLIVALEMLVIDRG
jgi:hypothetical protein